MSGQFYKVLGIDGRCYHSGREKWFVPPAGIRGRWMPPIKDLEIIRLDERGYQVATKEQLVLQLGPVIWEVEVRGNILRAMDICVVEQGRLLARMKHWSRRTARLFAADCAERVLPIFKEARPNEPRIRRAIAAARDLAMHRIRLKELQAAALAAMKVAADMDPSTSGGIYAPATANREVLAAISAVYSTSEDAFEAANQAARAAARVEEFKWEGDDAKNPERVWQTARLFTYLEGKL